MSVRFPGTSLLCPKCLQFVPSGGEETKTILKFEEVDLIITDNVCTVSNYSHRTWVNLDQIYQQVKFDQFK